MIAQASKAIVRTTGDGRVGEPQLLEITQASATRRQFPIDGRVEAVVLEVKAAKRPHQRHVVDDIDHLAIDGRGLVGEIVMQGLTRGPPGETSQSPLRLRRRSIPRPSAGSRCRSTQSPRRVAMHGGSTFQTNIFSMVKTALEVAVIRQVSIPGNRSEK
jgi:hypothetical protein